MTAEQPNPHAPISQERLLDRLHRLSVAIQAARSTGTTQLNFKHSITDPAPAVCGCTFCQVMDGKDEQ